MRAVTRRTSRLGQGVRSATTTARGFSLGTASYNMPRVRPSASLILLANGVSAAVALSAVPATAAAARAIRVSALDLPATRVARLPAEALRNIASLGARTFAPRSEPARRAAMSERAAYYGAANRPGGVCLVVSLRGGRGGQISSDGRASFRKDGALYLGGPFGRDRARVGVVEARVVRNVFVLPVKAPGPLELLGPERRRSIDHSRVRQFWLEWDVRERPAPAPGAVR